MATSQPQPSCMCVQKSLLREILTQIPKARIHRTNQRQLLLPPPSLDLFFPANGPHNLSMRLKINQSRNIVFFRKPFREFRLMLPHPPLKKIRNARLQHPGGARENINMVNSHAPIVLQHPRSSHSACPERSRRDRAWPRLLATVPPLHGRRSRSANARKNRPLRSG